MKETYHSRQCKAFVVAVPTKAGGVPVRLRTYDTETNRAIPASIWQADMAKSPEPNQARCRLGPNRAEVWLSEGRAKPNRAGGRGGSGRLGRLSWRFCSIQKHHI